MSNHALAITMSTLLDYASLEVRFANAEALPDLPAAALRLSQMLDSGEASATELERVILGDPGLTAGLLRAASAAAYGIATKPITTVKQAILVLGQKAVRAVAVSLWIQAMVSESFQKTSIDPARFNQHSLFVGFLSRYLLSIQRSQGVRSSWTPDEVFAAGVLHDVAKGLMATLEPQSFRLIFELSKMKNIAISHAFRLATGGQELGALGAISIRAWGLPDMFAEVCEYFTKPWEHPTESVPLMCLHYADYLANDAGFGVTENRVEMALSPQVQEVVGLPEEDIESVVKLVAGHTRTYSSSKAA